MTPKSTILRNVVERVDKIKWFSVLCRPTFTRLRNTALKMFCLQSTYATVVNEQQNTNVGFWKNSI